MKIGDWVNAPVNDGQGAKGKVIDFKGDYVVIAGEEELRRAAATNRSPIGLGFHKSRLMGTGLGNAVENHGVTRKTGTGVN